jgi:lipopolysaccharide transport system permease protein
MNPHAQQPTSFVALFNSFWLNRPLIYQMIRREVVGRYRGSVLGIVWSFFTPFFMLLVYTFVFSVIFKARWGGVGESKVEFAVVLFAGMIVHSLFAEVLNRAPTLIQNNTNYVKRVVFPLEILSIVSLGSALFHTAISLIVLLLVITWFNGAIHLTALLIPLVWFPLILAALGFGWFLASLGVFLRDVGQVIGILTTVLMFLAPIFYPLDAIPEEYQVWILANPLTFIIIQSREVLVWGRPPDWYGLSLYMLFSLAVLWAGFWWFQKTRRGFADVL